MRWKSSVEVEGAFRVRQRFALIPTRVPRNRGVEGQWIWLESFWVCQIFRRTVGPHGWEDALVWEDLGRFLDKEQALQAAGLEISHHPPPTDSRVKSG